jgi:hypothetical protein
VDNPIGCDKNSGLILLHIWTAMRIVIGCIAADMHYRIFFLAEDQSKIWITHASGITPISVLAL